MAKIKPEAISFPYSLYCRDCKTSHNQHSEPKQCPECFGKNLTVNNHDTIESWILRDGVRV
jgi:Zn finger protein HypA/HybF involved in hydrogenase expression